MGLLGTVGAQTEQFAALVAAFVCYRQIPGSEATDGFLGSWQGTVRYGWGDRYDERFEFKRHAGELTGTATFLKYPRAIVDLRVDGPKLHFETHSLESLRSEAER